jgi:hypothetical protein
VQDMQSWKFRTGVHRSFFVKLDLDIEIRRSIALTIFQEVSLRFEAYQDLFPFGIFSG